MRPACLEALDPAAAPYRVELEITHDPAGFVTETDVVNASSACLAEAAVTAVEKWRYPPRLIGDRLASREGVRVLFLFNRDTPPTE